MTRFEELTKLFDPWRGLALPADGVGLQHSLATNSLISQLPRPHSNTVVTVVTRNGSDFQPTGASKSF